MKCPLNANMRMKKPLSIGFVGLLVLSMTIVMVPASAEHPAAAIWVEPAFISLQISENFTVDVMINITDPPGAGTGLWGFEYKLKWDSSILNVTSIQYHVPSGWTSPFEVVNSTSDTSGDGYADLHWVSLTTLAGTAFTGVMSLCTYTFHVTGLGSSALDFEALPQALPGTFAKLVDDTATLIDHTTSGGYFSNKDPRPIFSYSPDRPIVNETVIFDASASYSPINNTLDNYMWNFGDGTNATGVIVTHNYTAFGSYIVNLTIADNQTNTGTTQKTITVRGYPEAFFTILTDRPIVDESVRFRPQFPEKPNGGTIVSYKWDFGDGKTKTTTKWDVVGNTYKTFGTYNVTLTVTDSEDLSDTYWTTVKVLALPVANFSYSPAKPTTDETITFDASASYDPDGSIVSYFWKFGDGTNDTGKVVTHAYTALGAYNVTLTVTDNDNLTDTTKQLVSVKLISNISISASPTTLTVGESTTISGSITPTRAAVNVTIYYRLTGEPTWNKLATVSTDENSKYSYDWKPPAVGTYEVYASWPGDATYHSAESSRETIKVQKAAPSYILYVVVIIVIAIAAAIAVYFLKIRKS